MTELPPLIALAQGRKPRARRAPVTRPLEIHLHMTVAKLLRDHCRPDWQWCHIDEALAALNSWGCLSIRIASPRGRTSSMGP